MALGLSEGWVQKCLLVCRAGEVDRGCLQQVKQQVKARKRMDGFLGAGVEVECGVWERWGIWCGV